MAPLLLLWCPHRPNRLRPDGRILAGDGLLVSPTRAKYPQQRALPARFSRNLGFLGGARKPLQRRGFLLRSGLCRLGRLPGVGRGLNGYLLPSPVLERRLRQAATSGRLWAENSSSRILLTSRPTRRTSAPSSLGFVRKLVFSCFEKCAY